MSDVDAAIEADSENENDQWGTWDDPAPETVENTVDPEPVAYDTGTADYVAPDADAAIDHVDAVDEADASTPARRAPVALEADVKYFCDEVSSGTRVLEADKYLTPHALSVLIGEKRGGTKADRPSSGACQATLKRWVEIGFIEANDKPFSFKNYTEAGQEEGLTAVKAKFAANAKDARKAIREAKAEAAKSATATATPED